MNKETLDLVHTITELPGASDAGRLQLQGRGVHDLKANLDFA